MNDYICRRDAISLIKHYIDNPPKNYSQMFIGGMEDAYYRMLSNLNNFPSADVVPVRHGKWLKEDRGHVEYDAVCSVCGFDWMWSDRGYFKFCPGCGAKMDGEE